MDNSEINSLLKPFASASRVLADSEKNIQNLQQTISSLQRNFRILEGVARQQSGPYRAIAQSLEALRRQTQTFDKDFWSTVQNIFEQLHRYPDETRAAVIKLAEYGWYVDPSMPSTMPQVLAKAMSEGSADEVSSVVEKYFNQRIDEIERRLCSFYPHRKLLLSDAFAAHRMGTYNLAIPIFLIQADGIWWDTFSRNLFTRKGRLAGADDHKSNLEDSIAEKISEVFHQSIPLWQSEAERKSNFQGLNRHQVLHGESLDYGTESNSLRCISLLNFLSWILNISPIEDT